MDNARDTKKINGKVLLVHIMGCLLFLTVPFFMGPEGIEDISDVKFNPNLQREILEFVLLLLFFYVNYFFLIPQFYFGKRYFIFFLIIIVVFFLVAILPQLVLPFTDKLAPEFHKYPLPPSHTRPHPSFFDMKLIHDFFIFLAVIFISITIKINSRLRQTEREKLNTELSYLRSQINPHFLFNTLNSIYSLALEKSDKAPTAVVKLSAMMRYVISETDSAFVSLEKDVNYLEDYIELQKIRLGNTVKLAYKVTGELKGKRIAPLILIPFIENAFKHGVNPEENSKILITVEITGNDLVLKVQNNKVNLQIKSATNEGMGIENAKTRLQLLYPSKHKLIFKEDDTKFEILLQIKLG
jgi:hypothetical protein